MGTEQVRERHRGVPPRPGADFDVMANMRHGVPSLPGFSRHPLFGLFQLAVGIALLALLITGKLGGC